MPWKEPKVPILGIARQSQPTGDHRGCLAEARYQVVEPVTQCMCSCDFGLAEFQALPFSERLLWTSDDSLTPLEDIRI